MLKLARHILIIGGLGFVLLFVNSQIKALDLIKTEGETVLLQLRPVDPRAFMQGDFMVLRYSTDVLPDPGANQSASGKAILTLDENRAGVFNRVDDGTPLGDNEIRINFTRVFRGEKSYGGERFFFQEGTAGIYEDADYGVFKVGASGRAILVGLAGEDFKTLKPEPKPSP